MDGGHFADIVGDGAEAAVDFGQLRPVASFVRILELVHGDEKLVQAGEANALGAAVEGERVLLQRANQVKEAEVGGVRAHFSGLVTGPVVSFIGEYKIAGHIKRDEG
jgi:hypothetical protein